MKRLLVLLLLSLVVLVTLALPTAHAQSSPLVLAFYYDWFDENTWKPDKVPDMPAPLYASRDPGAISRHIQQARDAGIDAFVVSWWGAGNPTDDNFKVMLDLASRMNFHAAVDFELTSPFYNSKDDVVNSLRNLIANRVNHPGYLRSEGKPVIFFWREQKYSVDEWKVIRAAVDPNHQTLWIAEGVKEQLPYLSVFDGFHLYSIAWAPDVNAELQKWSPRVHGYGAEKIWVATTMPGADNSRTSQSEKVIRDRRGGEFYRETWRAAFSTYPDWVIITSWNEWPEGTMIEPSVMYGNTYLDITRGFASQFHAGLPTPTATPTRTSTPTRTPTNIPTATFTPTVVVSATSESNNVNSNARATVMTDTLTVYANPSADASVIGKLRKGNVVPIIGRTDDVQWWQITLASTRARGWIIADWTGADGEIDMVPVVSSSLVITPTATLTATPEPTQTPTLTPIVEIISPTNTPTTTRTFTPTPAPFFSFPPLKSILPFLP